jgi:hypothetical protein
MTNALGAGRSLGLAVGCGVAMLLVSGCHVGPHPKSGAGESIDVCSAMSDYNALTEPDVTDRSALIDYLAAVQRIFGRVDKKADYSSIDGTKTAVPSQILTTVAADNAAYAAEAKLVTAASTPVALHTAVQTFTTSTGLSSADTELELWATSNCA